MVGEAYHREKQAMPASLKAMYKIEPMPKNG
jgi:hypothetical protein